MVFASAVEVLGANIVTNHPTLATGDPAADYLLIHDATDGLVKKILQNNLGLSSGSGTDWVLLERTSNVTIPANNSLIVGDRFVMNGTGIILTVNAGANLTVV